MAVSSLLDFRRMFLGTGMIVCLLHTFITSLPQAPMGSPPGSPPWQTGFSAIRGSRPSYFPSPLLLGLQRTLQQPLFVLLSSLHTGSLRTPGKAHARLTFVVPELLAGAGTFERTVSIRMSNA